MLVLLNNFLISFILVISFYLLGKEFFEKDIKINIKNVILFILTSFTISLTHKITSINIATLVVILILFIYNKILFKRNNRKTLFISLFYYISLIASDSIIEAINTLINISLLNNFLIHNLLIIIINYFIISFTFEFTKEALVNTGKNALYNIFTFILTCITITCLLLFKIPSLDTKNIEIIINTTLLVIFILITLIHIIKDILYAKDVAKDYLNTMKYIKDTEKLLEEYRFSIHENRNQLIMIRNMLGKKKDKKIIEYIDSLIAYKNELDALDSWTFKNLCNIPFTGLKEFIDYKLCEMKEENIEIEAIVSKDIKTLNEKLLTTKDKEELYSIVGIILDNAKEAIFHSSNKHFSLQVYLADDNINLVFANSYKNPINTAKIFLSGFTNKGPKHGNGLAIAKRIAEGNPKFNLITDVLNEYFIQTLTIKTKNHHKITKKHLCKQL